MDMEEPVRDTSPYFPSYEEIAGTPEEVIQGARSWPSPPLETLWAQCLDDASIRAAGRYWYANEQILLDDQTSYTASDWTAEAHHHSKGLKAPLHKFWCDGCEAITFHFALDERAIRGILMKLGLV